MHVLVLTGEDDLRDVKSAVADLAGKWKDLGISLGIRLSELNAILSTSPHSSSDCLSEMLALWLKQCHNVRTKLIHCLPSHIYYTKYTSLATKQSRLKPLKNLSSYVIPLIIGNYTSVVCCFLSTSQVEIFGKPTLRSLVMAVKDKVGGNNPALAHTIAREHPGK